MHKKLKKMPAIQFMQTETRKRTVILMIPSSVKEEVYFPRRRLIFRFGGRVMHHSKRSFRVHSEIDFVCLLVRLSVCTTTL